MERWPRALREEFWFTNGSPGGGLYGSELPASWAAEGLAMRRAIAADFACLPGGPVHVIVTSDPRLPARPGPLDDSARRQPSPRERDSRVTPILPC